MSYEIFRAGTRTDANGNTVTITEADLAAAAQAYDPKVHEAPIVVGHPKADAPAYGWVKSLGVQNGVLTADFAQVDEGFADLVKAGRYKKVSASFYPPTSPNNPKPGVWTLRHVGFLGAQPPAVKGLSAISFAEGEVYVEFTESPPPPENHENKETPMSLEQELAAEKAAREAAEKKAAEEEAARKAEVEAQKKAAAQQLAATEQAGAQAGKRRVQVAPADAGEAAVNKELAKNWPLAQLRKYFNLQEQARRLVITVDNLPREHVPSQLRITRGVPELLRVQKDGETITLDPSNYERYDRIISYVEKMDARKIGRLYAKFYPLLQRTYEETGFPEERFHDRVLAALDDMMDAPRPTGPIRLVQPKVLYRFEDDHLESLSAGQKIMIRVGPDNAARLRKVLARVRAAIAARDPDELE